MKTIPYINIHTHHLSNDKGVCVFNNRFGFDKFYITDKHFSIGIHPWDTKVEFNFGELEQFIQHKNCLAIGECGLDTNKGEIASIQESCFITQLQLAEKYNKPLIIHCVGQFEALIKLCKPYISKIPLIIHGYNKSEELAKQLLQFGFYISISTAILKKTKFNMQIIPVQKLFLETDDDKELHIAEVYRQISKHYAIPESTLQENINTNFEKLFLKNGR